MLAEMGLRVWLPDVIEPALETIAENPIASKTKPPSDFSSKIPSEVPSAVSAVQPKVIAETGTLPAGIAQMDWSALEAAVAGCRACALCNSRKQTVFGAGNRQARWLVVGEAPGENEDLQGEPFVGNAGQLLDNMLFALGLGRKGTQENGVFITNVLKCRPPSNRNPQAQEMLQCDAYLQRQVQLLQPSIILALGRFAAQSLLQPSIPDVANVPLGKLRQRVHHYQGVPVIVSYHPAYLLRSLGEKAKAWADLCLAMDVMQGLAPHTQAAAPSAQ